MRKRTATRDKKTVSADAWALASAFAKQYESAKEIDAGAIYLAILDILDSVVELYGEDLPRIARLKGATIDDLLGELVDLRMDLDHIRYHADEGIRNIDQISEFLRAKTLQVQSSLTNNGERSDETESPAKPKADTDARIHPLPLRGLAEKVLQEAGRPLHYREITTRITHAGLWPGGSPGKTPEASLYRAVTEDVRLQGEKSKFRYKKGEVRLREWGQVSGGL
ncbi:MAG: winged helix-turn-helix domain-containing protein [Chloroflexi bacterium]|nr:winged helix-turn-helix domain-containing protein [Chloroflexota bacterium]